MNWRADHFKHWPPGTAPPAGARHPLATFAKNVAGVVLVLLGLVMALPGIPGQGILTMIVGHHADRLSGQARTWSAD